MNNAEEILKEVDKYISELENFKAEHGFNKKLYTRSVYNKLSIFDWWVDVISLNRLKDMKKFLQEAIKLGFTGYVCFKVGASGCANGMWAHTDESTTGYSPDCDFLYKSFTPAYNYWDITYYDKDKKTSERLSERVGKEYDELTTIKKLEDAINVA